MDGKDSLDGSPLSVKNTLSTLKALPGKWVTWTTWKESMVTNRYGSLSLLTDLYQLTMAYGYWKEKREERAAVFHLYFRNCPFQGGYAIAGGLGQALEYLQGLTFASDDLEYLRDLAGNDGQPLFEESFLEYLRELTLEIDVDAIPEGTIVFPNEPLMRVKGPLLQCQLIETAC